MTPSIVKLSVKPVKQEWDSGQQLLGEGHFKWVILTWFSLNDKKKIPGVFQVRKFIFLGPNPKLFLAKNITSNYATKTNVRFFSFLEEVKCEKNAQKKPWNRVYIKCTGKWSVLQEFSKTMEENFKIPGVFL